MCRFSSLVGVSISDPELRFINMVLSSAISNGLTYSFSKTATTFDLRDYDFRIWEGTRLHSSYCYLMLHIGSKELKFQAWLGLLMAHLFWHPYSVTVLLADQQLFGGCISLSNRRRIWSRSHCVVNLCFLSDIHTSYHI